MKRWGALSPVVGLALLVAAPAWGNATIVIVNADGANEGFNDPTPAAPVGGNSGTTIGAQRLIAFQFAADLWEAAIDSNVTIRIQANFDALSCDATSAIVGSAGTTTIWRDFGAVPPFPGAEFPCTWYHSALADKRTGTELNPGAADIVARFNSNLGQAGCLTGFGFYYGLDNNHGSQIDLVATLLHEFGHGLGFQQFATLTTGAQIENCSDVYGRNLLDTTLGLYWNQMSNAQRAASAVNTRRVVWDGEHVTAAVGGILVPPTPLLRVQTPLSIDGDYSVGTAQFGPPLGSAISAAIVQALDLSNASGPLTTDACSALTNPAAVAGRIAFVDRGTCNFTVKVKNCQNAGALGVVVADNAAGAPPPGLGGSDPTITIPAVRVTQADGNAIRAQLGAGVTASLLADPTIRLGADAFGRALVNTQNPLLLGSSVSHWDELTTPNQLMEPFLNSDLTHQVDAVDLTLSQLRDVGWFPDPDRDGLANALDPDDDNDGHLDGADCAPEVAGAFAIPAEIAGVGFASNHVTLSWTSAVPTSGSNTLHQVLRGSLAELPVGGAGIESCVGPGQAATSLADPALPAAGQGFWYDVRGTNVCGDGPYGQQSDGTPRSSPTCP